MDVAFKAVGVGSVGTICVVGLFLSGDGEPLFLQVKQAQRSVLERLSEKLAYQGPQGRRVVEGQRMMQAASDILLGWTSDEPLGVEFYVRILKNRRLGAVSELAEQEALSEYARLCGRTLARSHARTGDPAVIAGYMGRFSNPQPTPEGEAKAQQVFAGTDAAYGFATKYNLKTAWGTDILFDARMTAHQGAILATLERWYRPVEVLRMATATNAELLGMSGPRNPYPGKLGMIEAGALADLILVDGDPTANLKLIADPDRNFVLIMKDGRIVKETLAEGLAAVGLSGAAHDHMRLDLSGDRAVSERRRDRLCGPGGRLFEARRVARLDLAAQWRALAISDRRLAGAWRHASLWHGRPLDRPRSRPPAYRPRSHRCRDSRAAFGRETGAGRPETWPRRLPSRQRRTRCPRCGPRH